MYAIINYIISTLQTKVIIKLSSKATTSNKYDYSCLTDK